MWVFDEHGTPYLEAVGRHVVRGVRLRRGGADRSRRSRSSGSCPTTTRSPTRRSVRRSSWPRSWPSIVPVPDAKIHSASSGSEANDFLVKFVRLRQQRVGRAGPQDLHQPGQRLPRRHDGGDQPHRHRPHARRLRPAVAGLPPRVRSALLPERPSRRDRARSSSPVWRKELDDLIVAEGPETIAGFLAEPVTGGGGVVVPPDGYYAAIQARAGQATASRSSPTRSSPASAAPATCSAPRRSASRRRP